MPPASPDPDSWKSMRDQEGNPLPKPIDYVAAGTNAVLVEDGHVVLQKRADNGLWALPGGRMDRGECMAECAVREMWEETGLETRATRLVGVYSDPGYHSIMRYVDGEDILIVQYVIGLYEVERVGGEIAVSHESTDVQFWPTGALPDPLSPAAKIRITDALEGSTGAFMR